MPQIRYYDVDVHVHAKVSGVSDSGGDLTHEEAVRQVLESLRLIHGLDIAGVSVTETGISGRPVRRENRMLGYVPETRWARHRNNCPTCGLGRKQDGIWDDLCDTGRGLKDAAKAAARGTTVIPNRQED